ncbi:MULTISPECIES: iron-containing alcohol dehydrogenase [unclassified Arsukibacterium]|uniref:iron-containing alcohol dehydrogenase n=1 Tax=unclassified Arsukibacterium TaxID=2635278 RepID=UPI000C562846|nr:MULTISPECIES: iron-containing alcohol dehydrogenase [unclassified Arsukibacterium]MAA94225.1 NADH-dependent alcohol dehydrogenase [Rheinheimera sp.]MBM34476.1 NADH-dependent alcohol dehydrogenase [Rheinheimera sp.]|tara:strand:- start:247 stop:1401 length:1155 start_codon:yes stop_codon:yes gene_type:complete
MLNFSYQNPTRIVFGKDQLSQLAKLIPAGSKVLMLYGGGSIKHNGVYEQVTTALADYDWQEFSGIEPNPSFETLMKAADLVREQKIDFLLPVGGGSVIDGAKFVAAAAVYPGDAWDILANRGTVEQAVALGCVLTLPATGTESNGNSVVTRYETQQKLAFSSPLVYPQFAILDPSVTFSLPPRQVANGVVDAFVHVIEQYLTYPVNAPVQDRFAEGLLQTLIEEGPKALSNPDDYEVRANIMWAATMALNGLIGQGVPQDWATHMIGHEITALYGLDHAQTLAIVLPALMQQQRAQKRDKLLQFGQRVWQLSHQDEERLIDDTITHTRAFFEQMGVPTRLADYGIAADAVDKLLAKLQANGMVKLGEHGDIDLDVSRQILQKAV